MKIKNTPKEDDKEILENDVEDMPKEDDKETLEKKEEEIRKSRSINTEKDLRLKLSEHLKEFLFTPIETGTEGGFPDTIVFAPDRRIILLELKTHTSSNGPLLRPSQIAYAKKVYEKSKTHVHVLSVKPGYNVIEGWLVLGSIHKPYKGKVELATKSEMATPVGQGNWLGVKSWLLANKPYV